jgi:hypothetical protein
MKTRTHPTHHDNYRAGRVFWGVAIALVGLFGCVFLATMDTAGASNVGRLAKRWALWAGGLAFVAGSLYAAVIDIAHRFTRCPSCRRRILRSRIDYQQSYYPCRRCDVVWTCPCHKQAIDA